jgi:PPM family protein phosphatase
MASSSSPESGPFLTSCAGTDVGRAREKNEDAFVLVDLDAPAHSIGCKGERIDIASRRMLLALSDGMGGHSAGEVASALALKTLVDHLAAQPLDPAHLDRQLDAAVQAANTAVHTAASTQGRHGMGATLTAALLVDGVAWIAEVGDSRAYLLRNNKLCQLTRDQSFVQMLVDTGAMTEDQARTSSHRNVILQAIGVEPSIHVALGRLDLRRGDRLLLCSDGLSNEVEDAELAALLSREAPAAACEHAIARANQHGGRDNITSIVAVLDGEALPAPQPDESIAATHQVIQEYRYGADAETTQP